MSTDRRTETSERELPRAPRTGTLNMSSYGEPTEYSFEKRYGEYKSVPYYEEAKKAYLSKTLNRKNEFGVNTWHEQLIAGRITPEDMKILTYTNLGRFSALTHVILMQMTKERDPMDARTIRAVIEAAKTSRPYIGGQRDSTPSTLFRHALYIAEHFGADTVRAVNSHEGVQAVAHNLLHKLLRSDPEKARQIVRYVDDFFNELDEVLPKGTSVSYMYRDHDWLTLLDGGVSPKEAAVSLIQHLSPERAVEAVGISRAVAEGVL